MDPMEVKDSDYFKSVTSSILKKREEHLKKTLERANREYGVTSRNIFNEE